MSVDYPELKFFEDIGYYKFKIVTQANDLKIDQEITLQKKNGLTFNFKIVEIYNKTEITIVPTLPLLGKGGRIFTELLIENDNLYLINKLDH